MKTIVFTPRAAKEFDALPAAAQTAIESALSLYAIEGSGDVKKLQGREGHRLRVGDYRVVFDDDRRTVLALTIGRRQSQTYG